MVIGEHLSEPADTLDRRPAGLALLDGEVVERLAEIGLEFHRYLELLRDRLDDRLGVGVLPLPRRAEIRTVDQIADETAAGYLDIVGPGVEGRREVVDVAGADDLVVDADDALVARLDPPLLRLARPGPRGDDAELCARPLDRALDADAEPAAERAATDVQM